MNLKQFKNAVKDYNISKGRVLKWVKNDKLRAKEKCAGEGCVWMIFCDFKTKRKTFQIKNFKSKHTCYRGFEKKKANTNWVIKKLVKRLMTYPKLRHSKTFDHIKKDV